MRDFEADIIVLQILQLLFHLPCCSVLSTPNQHVLAINDVRKFSFILQVFDYSSSQVRASRPNSSQQRTQVIEVVEQLVPELKFLIHRT